MIKVAAGTKLELKQNAIKYDGHAIECRINAEDPDNGFFPSPGIVEKYLFPNQKISALILF